MTKDVRSEADHYKSGSVARWAMTAGRREKSIDGLGGTLPVRRPIAELLPRVLPLPQRVLRLACQLR